MRVGGRDSSGNKRTLLLKSGGELPTYSPCADNHGEFQWGADGGVSKSGDNDSGDENAPHVCRM